MNEPIYKHLAEITALGVASEPLAAMLETLEAIIAQAVDYGNTHVDEHWLKKLDAFDSLLVEASALELSERMELLERLEAIRYTYEAAVNATELAKEAAEEETGEEEEELQISVPVFVAPEFYEPYWHALNTLAKRELQAHAKQIKTQ